MIQIQSFDGPDGYRNGPRAAPSGAADDRREDQAVVHVVDGDADAQRTLCGWLTAAGLAARAYADLAEFLGSARPDAPGCLVVDMGLELTAGLRGLGLRLPVVASADQADVAMAVRAMKTGAFDFVEKPFRQEDILAIIKAAVALDRTTRTASVRIAEIEVRFDTLSAREKQVMALVTAGKLNKQAAGDLGLSEITIKAHRGSAMRKMGARSLAELVRMADMVGEAVRADS